MSTRTGIVLAALLAIAALFPLPGAAGTNQPASPAAITPAGEKALQQSCPVQPGQRLDLAEGTPTDCCKGHKGICGCRAGKIVCCDGTVSPNCTCHSDWGVAN